FRQLRVSRKDVTVDLLEPALLHGVDRRIEVVQVSDEISQGVADLPVRLRRARENLLAETDLLPVVAHRHPQPQDVGAVLLEDLLRLDRVAERLRHLASVLGDDEAVRQDLLERRTSTRAEADDE